MQPLDDDMDELFRRAGEDYPLNTNGSDWDNVLQQLHAGKGDLQNSEKGGTDYRYLWLLLLLPIGFVCGRYVGTRKILPEAAVNKTPGTAPLHTRKSDVTRVGKTKRQVVDSSTNKTVVGKNDSSAFPVNKADAVTEGVKGDAAKVDRLNGVAKWTGNSQYKTLRSKARGMITESKVGKELASNRSARFTTNASAASGDELKNGAVETPSLMSEKVLLNSGKAISATVSTAPVDTTAANISRANEQVKVVTAGENKSVKQKNFKSSLSYSLVFGPDVSTVKFQKTSKIGYSFGLMLNYHFAKRLTLEAGALWDRKNYYTEGKYMDTAPLKLPMRSVVNTATGYCNMIEILLNVKYQLISRKRDSWFVSAGLSSYLMKNETYDISYERYGQSYVKDYGYLNSTKDWLSVIHLSMGYQNIVGKHTLIGIAPYIKLPMKGIGTGKLPVESTGVYFTIGRSLK